jgi:hypothetical protein
MQIKKTATAFAVLALCSAVSFAAQAAPTVAFTQPANGQILSGVIKQSSACEVTGSNIARVKFYLNATLLNAEDSAPWNCNIDTTAYGDGTYTLRAVAYDAAGTAKGTSISVTLQNGNPPAVLPLPPTSGELEIWFKAPAKGATVSGVLRQEKCYVAGRGVKRVEWFLDSTRLMADLDMTNGMTCVLDTRKFPNGSHTLWAIAYDGTGKKYEEPNTINIQNAVSGTNTPPTVALTAPAVGATLSGPSASYQASASDTGGSVAKVDIYVGPTLVSTKTAAPYQGSIDTTKFANGTHTLKAVATDDQGATASALRSVTISNTGATEPPLPSTNTKAIATFESLGLYWTPPSNPGAAGCNVRFRKQGETTWYEGFPMWYDSRNSECRGSLVHLAPDTSYEVQFSLPGQQPVAQVNAKTWSESFPIAQTVFVSDTSQPLNITQGGTASGYVLYTPAAGSSATINVGKGSDYNIKISAPYVIIRGLTLKGARMDAIQMYEGAHDIVIEDNDISDWGSWSGTTTAEGWKVARNKDSAIKAYCTSSPWLERTIIQRNKIHHPTYGANSWSEGHPLGSNAVYMLECGGEHVWRYNDIYSDTGRYFMDAFGGGENFSNLGFPNADSDIYGNRISQVWDDAIEAEGANRNVRIWGNYFDQTTTGVATTSTSKGPVYVFRNVWNRSRHKSSVSHDSDDPLYMFKSGSQSGYGDGRRYMFHNTMLQAPPPPGSTQTSGGGEGLSGPNSTQKVTNTVSRNNVYHVRKTWWASINTQGGANDDLDYDLVNGNVTAYAGAEPSRIVGTPLYAAGHGWVSEGNGLYQLDPSSPGYDRGVRLPNFNDGYTGAAPDMGAHEAGTPAMRLGVNGSASTWADATGGGTTTSSTTTSGTTSSTGSTSTSSTSSSGGVCSTMVCVITQ